MRAQFFSTLASAIEPFAATASTPLAVADKVLHESSRLLVDNCDQFDSILAAAKDAWEKFVVPINIPQIPDVIEPAIERAAWAAIEAALRAIHAKLHSVQNS